MQKELQLKTTGGHALYGTLDSANTKAEDLLVFVHAYTGNKDDRLLYNAARFFSLKGFDAFRFDLYSAQEGGRAFRNTSLQTYADDLQAVLQHFNSQYKNIHVVGHSLGGTVALFADAAFVRSLVLWEPADMNLSDEDVNEMFEFNKDIDAYISKGGFEFVVGKELINDLQNLDSLKLISKVTVPTYIIGAGKGNKAGAERFFERANEPKKIDILEDADHCFEAFTIEEKLFSITLRWVQSVPDKM